MITDRVVLVRGREAAGTGYQVSQDLVLTAGHVAGVGAEVCLPRVQTWHAARSVWHDETVDVALLHVENPSALPSVAPAEWGLLACTEPRVPAVALGFPRFQASPDGFREYAHENGTINPLTGSRAKALITFHASNSPPGDDPEPWHGMSGAALLSGDRVVGVIVNSHGASTRLEAVPVTAFLSDRGFRSMMVASTRRIPIASPADLSALIDPGTTSRRPRSSTVLLRPTADVIAYYPTGDDLDELKTWMDVPGLGLSVVHGVGGIGKTRLAHELIRHRSVTGGTGCFVTAADPRVQGVQDSLQRLRGLRQPTLLVVDDAEIKPDMVDALTQVLLVTNDRLPIKLMLLARAAEQWWTLFRTVSSAVADYFHVDLRELSPHRLKPEESRRMFVSCVHALAQAMPAVSADTDWPALAERAVAGAAFSGADGTIVACQLAALAALHTANGDDQDASAYVGVGSMINRERERWQALAEGRKPPGSADDLVAAANLYGARALVDAQRLLRLTSGVHLPILLGDLLKLVVEILGRGEGGLWHPLQPSAVAERFVVDAVAANPALLTAVLPRVERYQATHALTFLGRAAAYDHPVWSCVTHTVLANPKQLSFDLLVGAAIAVPDPRALLDVIAVVHPVLDTDQRAMLTIVAGGAGTPRSFHELWHAYRQAHARSPIRELEQATEHALAVVVMLEAVRTDLVNTFTHLYDVQDLPRMLHNIAEQVGSVLTVLRTLTAPDGSSGQVRSPDQQREALMNVRELALNAFGSAEWAADSLAQWMPHVSALHAAPDTLSLIARLLTELCDEVQDIDQRLRSIGAQFDDHAPT